MYLIFDATPITKPTNYQALFSDTQVWPRMIHLSWILLNEELKPIEDFDCIVKPEGFKITPAINKYAQLEEGEVDRRGIDLGPVLDQFAETVEKAQYIFAHNLNANENIVAAEFVRHKRSINFFKKKRFCLMEEGTYYCKIPNKAGGYKWPTLNELHAFCFQKGYSPGNNARADVIAAARCFIKMKKTGKLEDLFES
ncbi:MAG: hypothetical protein IPN79_03915 [Saprospiraceae bacterium]|nr:hypothetical protein [Saprospiraceae bacterium]